jgi:hypothetical protein
MGKKNRSKRFRRISDQRSWKCERKFCLFSFTVEVMGWRRSCLSVSCLSESIRNKRLFRREKKDEGGEVNVSVRDKGFVTIKRTSLINSPRFMLQIMVWRSIHNWTDCENAVSCYRP